MTEEEAEKECVEVKRLAEELAERVEDLENEREAIKRLPTAVAELHGTVNTLKELVLKKLDGISETVTPGRWDTLLKFAQFVIVPILVALITGWFLYKSQIPSESK